MDTARCPLDECHGPHELHTARNGRQFVVCDIWKQRVFFNPGTPTEYLVNANNGGSIPIKNPDESDEPQTIAEHYTSQRRGRRIRTNPNEEPEPLPTTPHPNWKGPTVPADSTRVAAMTAELARLRAERVRREALEAQGIDPDLGI